MSPEQTTKIPSRNDAANRNGDDTDEIPMEHRLVRRINYEEAFLYLSSDKKTLIARGLIALSLPIPITSSQCSYYANYTRDRFIVVPLASWYLSTDSLATSRCTRAYAESRVRSRGNIAECTECMHWFSIFADSFSIRALEAKKTIRA